MTCRHPPEDPNCTHGAGFSVSDLYRERDRIRAETPDSTKFTILEFKQVANHLILRVQYPNCRKCSYEGVKILVYLHTNATDVIFWKEIDPHFADPKVKREKHQAPSPNARFPANEQGWLDALEYAGGK